MKLSPSELNKAEALMDKLTTLVLLGIFHATKLKGKTARVSMAVAIEMCAGLDYMSVDEKTFMRYGKTALSVAMEGLPETGRRDLLTIFAEFKNFA